MLFLLFPIHKVGNYSIQLQHAGLTEHVARQIVYIRCMKTYIDYGNDVMMARYIFNCLPGAIFRDSVFWRHFCRMSFYNNWAIFLGWINREWFVSDQDHEMTWGWHSFKKGNNFPLSTPTVKKDVKMLKIQVEPQAAGKCGFAWVWRRFKHFDSVFADCRSRKIVSICFYNNFDGF